MNWIKANHGDVPIYITENGFSDYQGNLDDQQRIYYYKHYLNQLLKGKPSPLGSLLQRSCFGELKVLMG